MSTKKRARGRRAGVVFAFAVAAASAVAPRAARAQSDTATREAEARFKEGLRRHDAGDEEGARLSFVQAYSVLKRPNLLFNLARAEQLTGHPVDAIGHYKTFAADGTVAPADQETARKRIAELDGKVGHIRIDAPSGADVSVDGQTLAGKAPLIEPVDVSPGAHTVEARHGGLVKATSVSCEAGQTVTATLDLDATPPPDPTVAAALPVPTQVEVAGASGPLSAGPSTEKVVTVLALGVGVVAGVAVGVSMQAAAGGEWGNITTLQNGGNSGSCAGMTAAPGSVCSQLAGDASQRATDENIRTGAFIGAGVCAAAAGVVWLVWPNRKVVESRAHVVPLVAPGVGGLEFVTAF